MIRPFTSLIAAALAGGGPGASHRPINRLEGEPPAKRVATEKRPCVGPLTDEALANCDLGPAERMRGVFERKVVLTMLIHIWLDEAIESDSTLTLNEDGKMATGLERPRHDTSVTMRMPQQTKELIETAASTVSKSFSAFVVESARQHAVDVLLDRRVFNLTAEAAEAFAQVLDSPPAPTAKLRALMASRSPWE